MSRVARPRARRPTEYVEASVYLAEASEFPGEQFYLPVTNADEAKHAKTIRVTREQKTRLDVLARALVEHVDPLEREMRQAYSDYASQTSWIKKLAEEDT